MSALLQSKISELRGRLYFLSVGLGFAFCVIALVGVLAVEMFLDFQLDLDWNIRAGIIAALLIGIGLIVFRYMIRPMMFGPGDDEVALMVERHQPDFATRLIASIQLARPQALPPGSSVALARMMIAQTEEMAQPRDFRMAAKTDRVSKFALIALILTVATSAILVYARDVSGDLLKRALLGTVDVPRKTRIVVTSADKKIARGDSVQITSTAAGVIPADGRVEIQFDSGRTSEFVIDRQADAWTTTVPNVTEPFRYQFIFDDVPTPWYIVNVKGEATLAPLAARTASTTPTTQPHVDVLCLSGNLLAGPGQNVTLGVVLHGDTPKHVGLRVLPASGHEQDEQDLRLVSSIPAFSRLIDNVQESFRYRVKLNDNVSHWNRIEVLPRPVATEVRCTQTFPAYTGFKKPLGRNVGDLALLAGSDLKIDITANKPIKSAKFIEVGLGGEDPAKIDPADPTKLSATIHVPADKLTGFSVHLVDQDDIESRDEVVYRIQIVPDKPPMVRVTWPDRSEVMATSQSRMLIRYEASDDFGLQRLELHYALTLPGEAIAPGSEKILAIPIPSAQASIKDKYEWDFAGLQPGLTEGNTLVFWLETVDNNTATAVNGSRGVSDHFTVKIVSPDEMNADLASRAGEYFARLQGTKGEQETDTDMVRNLLLNKPTTKPAPQP